MPKGQLTPFPAGWIPLKTVYGWTAIRLKVNGGVTGCDFPHTPDGKYVAFWRRRKEVAEAIEAWKILAANEALQRENERLRSLLAQRPPTMPAEGLPKDISS